MLRKAVLALGLSLSLWPINGTFTADAQQAARVYRIGFLRVGNLTIPKAFWDSMREFGWVEGKNVRIEPRYADREDQLPHLAAELVRVDVILTNGTPSAEAAKQATSIIPIVFSVGKARRLPDRTGH